MDINNGSLMQLFANASQISQIRQDNSANQYIVFPNNISVVYEMYYFVNSTLTIPRNSDKILPEYLVFDLFNNETSLNDIYNYLQNVILVLDIRVQIIEIPLSLLWNLNTPEIINSKLYLQIPFEMFFGKIKLHGMNNNSSVTFYIRNINNLVNYAVNSSLMFKSYTYGNRDSLYDASYNIVQQISSIELNVSLNDLNNESREFVINTENFDGFIKGFFIESQNIDELQELHFFINGHVRTNYDRFLIRNNCVRINENMLFYPFNNDISYQERTYNSFDGAICLCQLIRSHLRVRFENPRRKVKIYGLNMNDYRQNYNQSRLIHNINNFHTIQDFNSHPLLSLDELTSSPLPISSLNINSVINNNINNNINNTNNINYINQYINYNIGYSGYTGPFGVRDETIGNSYSTGATGQSGSTYPLNNYYTIGYYNVDDNSNNIIDELPIGDTINQLISEDKKICGISWDEIQADDTYMSCLYCNNNFKEEEIKHWLQQRRNCPSCRGAWNNFNLYINTV